MNIIAKALLGAALAVTATASQAFVLTFEGIADYPNDSDVQVGSYYYGERGGQGGQGGPGGNSGGNGPQYGIGFSSNAVVRCLNTLGTDCPGSGSFSGLGITLVGGPGQNGGGSGGGTSRDGNPQDNLTLNNSGPHSGPSFVTPLNPSDLSGLYLLGGDSAYLDLVAGFHSSVKFIYVAIDGPGSVSVFDGLGGTGNLLGRVDLAAGAAGCPDYNAPRCPFSNGEVNFLGIGHSVVFAGVEGDITFDDIVIGVPEPQSWALLIAGFGLTGAALRRRRRVVAAV